MNTAKELLRRLSCLLSPSCGYRNHEHSISLSQTSRYKNRQSLFDRDRELRVRFTTDAIIAYLDYKPIEDICLKAVADRFRRSGGRQGARKQKG